MAKRTTSSPHQVNVMLSTHDKAILAAAAGKLGTNITTYMRIHALRQAYDDIGQEPPKLDLRTDKEKRAIAEKRARDEDYIRVACDGHVPDDFTPAIPGDIYDPRTRRMVPGDTLDDLSPEDQAAVDALYAGLPDEPDDAPLIGVMPARKAPRSY